MPLPGDAAAAVVQALAPWREGHPEARWIPADMLHLTLVFIGATDPRRIRGLEALISDVARSQRPFTIETDAAGGRIHRGGDGVAWLVLRKGAPETERLAQSLYDRLGPEVGGHRPPRPTPNPHLTVARRADRALLQELQRREGPSPVRWSADRIVLFRSHLGPPGARYEGIFSVPLG